MTGVPKSRGCEACRKHKKGCDKVRPICGRCKHLGIPCVGSGAKRWTFISETPQALAEQLALIQNPDNNIRVPSAWIYILGIGNVGHDVRPIETVSSANRRHSKGPRPAFDVSASALVTAYNVIQYHQPKIKALAKYVDALSALRVSLQKADVPVVVKIQTVYNVYICEQWLSPKQGIAAKHREAMAYLLRDAFYEGKLAEIPTGHIYGICQIVIWAGLLNPKITLDPWMWHIIDMFGGPRPQKYQRGQPDLQVWVEIFLFFQEPKKHTQRIHSIYDFMRMEKPLLHQSAERMAAAAAASDAPMVAKRLFISYRVQYGQLLIMMMILNRLCRTVAEDSQLAQESHKFVDEVFVMHEEYYDFRPFGGIFIHIMLAVAWGSVDGSYRRQELEKIMGKNSSEYWGAGCLENARLIKRRLDAAGSGAADAERHILSRVYLD